MNLRYWSNETNLIDLDEVIAIEVIKNEYNTFTEVVFRNNRTMVIAGFGILEQFKEYKMNMPEPMGRELI